MKRIIADQAMQLDSFKEVDSKKKVARTLVEEGFAKVSEVCPAVSLSRSSFYSACQRSSESLHLKRKTVDFSKDYSRSCYRRITALLRR